MHHQKNWSPFIFPLDQGRRENLFIYGVHPHRIVFVNESIDVGVSKVHTVAMTEFKHLDESQPIWSFGPHPVEQFTFLAIIFHLNWFFCCL